MKMLVWTDHHSFLVVAHAETVEKGRWLVLKEMGDTDGSQPNRVAVMQRIKEFQPTIWTGETADYAIEESFTESDRTSKMEPGLTFFS